MNVFGGLSRSPVSSYSQLDADKHNRGRERTCSVVTDDSVHPGRLSRDLEDEGWKVKDATCWKSRISYNG
jgi:hypothetical protein